MTRLDVRLPDCFIYVSKKLASNDEIRLQVVLTDGDVSTLANMEHNLELNQYITKNKVSFML